MEYRTFEPPHDEGEFFPMKVPSDDVKIYYHGTSCHFSPIIEGKGFQPEYRFVTDKEMAVLQKYAPRFVLTGTNYLPSLAGNKPITLASTGVGALRYIDPSRKGGIAKTLLDDLRLLLSEAVIANDDRQVLDLVIRRLEPVEYKDGIIYAIGLSNEERKRLEGYDPCHARMIPRSALLCAMVVPHGFRY
jgi:hypothetical protein